MASPGVYCGKIDNTVSSDTDSVILNEKLIQYDKGADMETSEIPSSIAMTEFHILMLFKNRFVSLKVLPRCLFTYLAVVALDCFLYYRILRFFSADYLFSIIT